MLINAGILSSDMFLQDDDTVSCHDDSNWSADWQYSHWLWFASIGKLSD